MQQPVDRSDLVRLAAQIKSNQYHLEDLLQAVYPIGAEVDVRVRLGVVRMKINGYGGSPINAPGILWGTSVESGRMQRFHFDQIIAGA
jgi:hypothetical protein